MNFEVSIYLLLDSCFEIKKNYFRDGFPPEIYEIIMCIQGAYFLSHQIRKNTRVYLVFQADDVVIQYVGRKLRYLGPDERSIGMLLMKALDKRNELQGSRKIQSTPGIWIQDKKAQDAFSDFGENAQIFMANENSTAGLSNITRDELILLIPIMKKIGDQLISNLNPAEFGIQDLPIKMRSYLTILKFYSEIDKLS